MRKFGFGAILCGLFFCLCPSCGSFQSGSDECSVIYNYDAVANNGETVSLKKYKGKVLLIVNTATHCGFTPQYSELQNLYETYKDQGLEILDFPCNQFAGQAPGTDAQIDSFCQVNFHTSFPRFAKTIVNDSVPRNSQADQNTNLFFFLQTCGMYDTDKLVVESVNLDSSKTCMVDLRVRWNFTKFLVDKNGHVVNRFEPAETKDVIEPRIKELLSETSCHHK